MASSAIPLRSRLAAAIIDHSPDWSAMAASNAMGAASRLSLPKGVVGAAVRVYSRVFDVSLADVDPAQLEAGFSSFDAFFTRTLRDGARPIDPDPAVVISPCDGAVRDVSHVDATRPLRAKGHDYDLATLLADDALAERFAGGVQATIYLHPRDYHRVHVPFDAEVRTVRAVPGRLLPVNDAAVARQANLFALNERMVHVLETVHGTMAVVMVAAFGVGHMTCSYADVAAHPEEVVELDLGPGRKLRKGDELGIFHLGSTVILVLEEGFGARPPLVREVAQGDPVPVMLGEALFRAGGWS